MASASPSDKDAFGQSSEPQTTGELIIGYDSPRDSLSERSLSRATPVDVDFEKVTETATGADVVELSEDLDQSEVDEIISDIQSLDGVSYVEENQLFTADTTDPYYGDLWGLHGLAGIDVPPAWTTTRGEGSVVAVLDTGITQHPDLDANVIPGYDFVSDPVRARDGDGRDANAQDEGDWYAANECRLNTPAATSSWHGTHVAGTIAAVADNNVGIVGAAPDAKILPVRVLAKCGGTTVDIADAIVWSAGGSVPGVPANANPADVINMSLGGGGFCSRTYQNAIDSAVGNGAAVVVSAGNSQANSAGFSPASCNNVINVAATDVNGDRAWYSNYGSVVDIAAPGGDTRYTLQGILSTLNNGQTTPASPSYASYQGTSMAAPHVAGVAALLKQSHPQLTPAQIEQRLKDTAAPLPGQCVGGCGAGLMDAAAAVNG